MPDKTEETKNTVPIMPITALALFAVSIILFFAFINTMTIFGAAFSLTVLLTFIGGLVLGIVSVCRGRKRNGLAGQIIAIAAVSLPASLIIFIGGIYAGLVTGLIPLM